MKTKTTKLNWLWAVNLADGRRWYADTQAQAKAIRRKRGGEVVAPGPSGKYEGIPEPGLQWGDLERRIRQEKKRLAMADKLALKVK
jgi:hypothetical protein